MYLASSDLRAVFVVFALLEFCLQSELLDNFLEHDVKPDSILLWDKISSRGESYPIASKSCRSEFN